MTLSLLLVAVAATVNPLRARSALPDRDGPVVAALGGALTWLALVPVAALASPLLDGLSVAPSTLRMGVGVALLLQGAVTAVVGPAAAAPALPGRAAALVPLAFPVLLTPGLALLVLSAATDRGAPVALAGLAAGLALVPAVGGLWRPSGATARERALGAAARLLAVALVPVGVALLVDGLFDL